MKVGDLVKSKLGNLGFILQAYTLRAHASNRSFGELFVDIQWIGGTVRTCYPAYRLEVISEGR